MKKSKISVTQSLTHRSFSTPLYSIARVGVAQVAETRFILLFSVLFSHLAEVTPHGSLGRKMAATTDRDCDYTERLFQQVALLKLCYPHQFVG